MKKSTRTFNALLVVIALALATCGCGGGSDSSTAKSSTTVSQGDGTVVASVGTQSITKAAVSHWMAALAGSDYYELSQQHTIPAGLVSDPPSYTRCVSVLEGAAAKAPGNRPTPTAVEMLQKCREIYRALREQAMKFLINAQWLTRSYSDYGVTVSEAELTQFFKRYQAERFPTASQLNQYLSARGLTLADEMLMVKLDLLTQRGLKKIEAGGNRAYATFLKGGNAWVAKTRCSAGYVVEHCRGFNAAADENHGPSAAVMMEQVAALATGRCINLAACAKS